MAVAHHGAFALFSSQIAAITIDRLFLTCKQFRRHGNIVHIGSGNFQCMNETTVLVHTDVCFIAEVPCVALLCLMGIRIPLLIFIFCRGRGLNNRRIYDGAFFQKQPLLLKKSYNLRKQFFL